MTGIYLRKVVGATGFEPATPCAQGRCATRLRYAPTLKSLDFTVFSNGTLIGLARMFTENLSQNRTETPPHPDSALACGSISASAMVQSI